MCRVKTVFLDNKKTTKKKGKRREKPKGVSIHCKYQWGFFSENQKKWRESCRENDPIFAMC
jgi:hypothetical protein